MSSTVTRKVSNSQLPQVQRNTLLIIYSIQFLTKSTERQIYDKDTEFVKGNNYARFNTHSYHRCRETYINNLLVLKSLQSQLRVKYWSRAPGQEYVKDNYSAWFDTRCCHVYREHNSLLRLNMTEKLFTGTLNHNQNKNKKTILYWLRIVDGRTDRKLNSISHPAISRCAKNQVGSTAAYGKSLKFIQTLHDILHSL